MTAADAPLATRRARLRQTLWSTDPMRTRAWEEPTTLAGTLLLVLVLLSSPATVPTTLLAVTGLVARHLLDRPWFWVAVAASFPLGLVRTSWLDWDNHYYLLAYWLLAVALTRFAPDPVAEARRAARWLIGLTFAFATFWKVAAPDFRTGEFFVGLTVLDPRIANVLVALGLQDASLLPEVAGSFAGAGVGDVVDVPVAAVVWQVATIAAWLTIAVEGAVALLFLTPLPAHRRWLRDAALVVFVIATYPVAPVTGFGWLLAVMGLSASELEGRRRTTVYLGVFLAIAVFAERNAVRNAVESVLSLLPGLG